MNIASLPQTQIRFKNIYEDSVRSANLRVPFDNLENGTKVLNNESECIRYLALYGGHHFYKLYAAYASTKFSDFEDKNIEIIDWGCGQALATCVLLDYFIEKNIHSKVSSITLIEPSQVALNRGHSLIQNLLQNDRGSEVRLVNKYLDDLKFADLDSEPGNPKIHLFSNILDVENFDLKQLYRLMVNSFQGLNRVICTSPGNGGKQRLDLFQNLFVKSHQVTEDSSSNTEIHGEVFYAANGRYENRQISRYEIQFTVELT